jgi:phage tail-like protein
MLAALRPATPRRRERRTADRGAIMNKARIATLLPYVVSRTARPGSVLDAMLEAMSGLLEPSLRILDDLDASFDPRRCTDPFVPMLARWVGLEDVLRPNEVGRAPIGLPAGSPQLRSLVAGRARLTGMRGTSRGLVAFLEIATGVRGFELHEGVDEAGQPRPFHITIGVPPAAAIERRLVELIVELEKPAHVTCEIALLA